MITNNLKTNNIDSIGTTLNIGATTATSISLNTTTTQSLTVTGVLTSEIITPTIIPSYVTYPIEQSSQRALQLFNSVTNGAVNNPIPQIGTITTINKLNAGPVVLSITLPIGVWSISYMVKFSAANAINPSNITYIMATATLDTPVTYNGVTYPKYLGLQAMPCSIQANSATNRTCFSGNICITNNVTNTLTLQCAAIYTISNLRIVGLDNTLPNTYLIATRIA